MFGLKMQSICRFVQGISCWVIYPYFIAIRRHEIGIEQKLWNWAKVTFTRSNNVSHLCTIKTPAQRWKDNINMSCWSCEFQQCFSVASSDAEIRPRKSAGPDRFISHCTPYVKIYSFLVSRDVVCLPPTFGFKCLYGGREKRIVDGELSGITLNRSAFYLIQFQPWFWWGGPVNISDFRLEKNDGRLLYGLKQYGFLRHRGKIVSIAA